ncbi:MAG: type II toxin-antitoxin system RelE/ParE family toxin [Bacteroidales bacterium]|jgi:plasmid stabilization system protein ParE|nr:type II toxin-antitoxin system RelE/ParE family toxin [Bacteroidales bacterium]MDD4384113.1 type II toxin-antitoxin system RelE/ParE family toxin [Bacteroidales bacterium]MDY0197196.1 type II toxin-antitoxin system RelE/ParE family toxin [Tenuifilaceae bacterium]
MSYQVRYSTRAYAEYEEILDYVVENFGLEVAAKVDLHFEEVINQISINPNLFPYSNKMKKLRRCVISPQTTLYYRSSGECVELASFRGNRMDPESLGL